MPDAPYGHVPLNHIKPKVEMTPQARKALEYVRNAGGNATTDSFMEDHDPIGGTLWHELRFPERLIHHDPAPGRDKYIVLTEAGRDALSQP